MHRPSPKIVVEESGTLGQLEAFLFAHGAQMTLGRNERCIWVARIQNARCDEPGYGLTLAGAIGSAVAKFQAATTAAELAPAESAVA